MAGRIIVDEEVCKGCGLCVSVCPKKLLELDSTKINSKGYNLVKCREQDCIACAMCGMICPDSAITVEKE